MKYIFIILILFFIIYVISNLCKYTIEGFVVGVNEICINTTNDGKHKICVNTCPTPTPTPRPTS